MPPHHGKDLNRLLVGWLLRGYRGAGGVSNRLELDRAVLEALQVLEHADVVQLGTRSPQGWSATGLGETALANGDFRQRIKDRTGG